MQIYKIFESNFYSIELESVYQNAHTNLKISAKIQKLGIYEKRIYEKV